MSPFGRVHKDVPDDVFGPEMALIAVGHMVEIDFRWFSSESQPPLELIRIQAHIARYVLNEYKFNSGQTN